jgi:hypothetical protein
MHCHADVRRLAALRVRAMRTRVATLLLLTATLVGCGGGDGGLSYDGPKQVADAAGCDQFKSDDQTTMFAAETGQCRIHGRFVSIDWFEDTKSRNDFRNAADQMGSDGVVIYGENFAITCLTPSDCDAIENEMGGAWPDN